MADFTSSINQTAVDKLLGSVSYPFTVLERRDPFPGCGQMVAGSGEAYKLTDEEIDDLLKDSSKFINDGPSTRTEHAWEDQMFSFGAQLIAEARRILDAAEKAGGDYEGPSKEELQQVLDGGIPDLRKNISNLFGDFGAYFWSPYLRVRLSNRPDLDLGSPQIDLDDFNVDAKATGELWLKFPWWNCYKWCFKWKKVVKCERAVSVTASLGVESDSRITLFTDGPSVAAKVHVKKLRIAKPILEKIPFESIANNSLKDKQVTVFDASKLVATIPVMGSKFAVDSINLPTSSDIIEIEVNVRQV